MDCKTIMVHLELEQPNDGLLAVAASLAGRLKADAIGIAGCQPIQLLYDETYVAGEIMEEDRDEIKRQLKQTEQLFREALHGKARHLEWRSTITFGPLADYIADEARAADLVITGPDIGGSAFDHTRQVRIADLIFQAGRPVLIVPKAKISLDLDQVVIGWKEMPECRRAVADALPLLQAAGHVSLVSIVPQDEIPLAKSRLEDVVKWLGRHGVNAAAEALAAKGQDADRFAKFAHEKSADLIVAGAYGHSRFREWVLGGVTGDFLINPDRCVLLSH